MAQGRLSKSIPKPFKSRKFILSVLMVTGATIGLYTGHVTWDQWFDFSKVILGIYGAANVGEHYTKSIKYKSDNERRKKEIEFKILNKSQKNDLKLESLKKGDVIEVSNGNFEKVKNKNKNRINTKNYSFRTYSGVTQDGNLSIRNIFKKKNFNPFISI